MNIISDLTASVEALIDERVVRMAHVGRAEAERVMREIAEQVIAERGTTSDPEADGMYVESHIEAWADAYLADRINDEVDRDDIVRQVQDDLDHASIAQDIKGDLYLEPSDIDGLDGTIEYEVESWMDNNLDERIQIVIENMGGVSNTTESSGEIGALRAEVANLRQMLTQMAQVIRTFDAN
jgi:polyhydroxyalkanoate synthesis regulator phasin